MDLQVGNPDGPEITLAWFPAQSGAADHWMATGPAPDAITDLLSLVNLPPIMTVESTPDLDRLRDFIREAGSVGRTRTEIGQELSSGKRDPERRDALIEQLMQSPDYIRWEEPPAPRGGHRVVRYRWRDPREEA
jgi:hypothetical protein